MEEFSERYFGTTIRALAANIPEFFNVDLSNLHLQADKLCRLAQALQNNTHLISLDLFGNPLSQPSSKSNGSQTDDVYFGWKRLGEVLGLIPTLRELDVGSCLLGDDGVQFLCLGGFPLEHYVSLLSLNVSPPPSLVTNTTLTTLDLSNNCLTDKGCEAIVLILKNKFALVELMLHNNNITAFGALKVAAAVSDKVHLTKVWLQQNPIDKADVECVVRAFKSQFSGRQIQIDNNETSASSTDSLGQ
jgi:Ran GTPase-activating protein (RanGAP) involved in mRNA processing and transport